MKNLICERDLPIWLAARPWLDVRSNDEHTWIAYQLGRALLRLHPEADGSVVLPAILLHDVGWKMFPEEQLAQAIGPNAKYPELQRSHELESLRIARAALNKLALPSVDVERVLAIVDGHDTRKKPFSIEDALMKDADKLWRFTAHGVQTIGIWFGSSSQETLAMLESFVLPSVLTDAGRTMALTLLAEGQAAAWMQEALHLSPADSARPEAVGVSPSGGPR